MKIIQVLNTMISNQNEISNVLKGEFDIYYFVYKEKYKWAINKSPKSENYFVYFFPRSEAIEDVVHADWTILDYIAYSTEDLKTKEALETFRELHQIVVSKVYGIDEMFDDIINNPI
jgi:hypothetical protein